MQKKYNSLGLFAFIFSLLLLAAPSASNAQLNSILRNSDFESGIEFWGYWSQGCSVEEIMETGRPVECGFNPSRRDIILSQDIVDVAPTADNFKSLQVTIQGDSQDKEWKSQLQTSVDPRYTMRIEKGRMILRFWAKANKKFESSVALNDSFAPYKSIGLYQKFELTPDWKQYSFVFNSEASPSATLVFNFGNSDDFTIFRLDQVELSYVHNPQITENEFFGVPFGKLELPVSGLKLDRETKVSIPTFSANGDKVYTMVSPDKIVENQVTVTLPENVRSGELEILNDDVNTDKSVLKIRPEIASLDLSSVISQGQEITLNVKGVSPTETFVEFSSISQEGVPTKVWKSINKISSEGELKVSVPYEAISGEIRVVTSTELPNVGKVEVFSLPMSIKMKPVLDSARLNGNALTVYGFGIVDANREVHTFDASGNLLEVIPMNNSTAFRNTKFETVVNVNKTNVSTLAIKVGNYVTSKKTVSGGIAPTNEVIVEEEIKDSVKEEGASISKLFRRTKLINGIEKSVFYIHGSEFGSKGSVYVGEELAETHYRRNDFIIAVASISSLDKEVVVKKKGNDVVATPVENKIKVSKVVREVKDVKGVEMGVLYIMGENFGSKGGVKVGDVWAETHYRRDNFIIAVVPKGKESGTVIVAK